MNNQDYELTPKEEVKVLNLYGNGSSLAKILKNCPKVEKKCEGSQLRLFDYIGDLYVKHFKEYVDFSKN